MRRKIRRFTPPSQASNVASKTLRKTVIASGTIGTGISLALFFASWWMHAFDLLVFPQFPGFLISSFLWGYPGFGHNPSNARGAIVFPYVMVAVNASFYGAITYALISISKRVAAKP
jgi:hypothetical protein